MSSKKKNTDPRGFILFEGPSELDGELIVVVATLITGNVKTGPTIQTWILKADKLPTEAVKDGSDFSICGDCPLRGINGKGRACYVVVYQAPQQIYRAYKAGRYPIFNPAVHSDLLVGRVLRIGSYGEPVAAPISVWKDLLPLVAAHTGYTHVWRDVRFQDYRGMLQASTHSPEESQEAQWLGWHTFRVSRYSVRLAGETTCMGGEGTTCEQCRKCDGTNNLTVKAHGSPVTLANYYRAIESRLAIV